MPEKLLTIITRNVFSPAKGNTHVTTTKYFYKYLVVFFPILLIALQSYFKQSINAHLFCYVGDWAVFVYLLARLSLFVLFAIFVFKITPDEFCHSGSDPYFTDAYDGIRNNQDPLLSVRAFACLCVFFGHWFLVVFPPYAPAQSTSEYLVRMALSFSPWSGVWIFFTLSGYLMGKGFATGRHNISRSGLIKFYRNRILRILPIYYISIFLVSILAKPEYLDFRNSGSSTQFMEALLFDQMGGGVIGALWSVSTEFQFYLFVPFVYLILITFLKRNRELLFASLLVVCLFGFARLWIIRHYPELWSSRVYYPLLANLDCFLCGLATSLAVIGFRKRIGYIKYGMHAGFIVLVLLYVIVSAWSYPEMLCFPGVPGSPTRPYYLSFAPGVTGILTAVIIYLFESSVRKKGGSASFWKIQSFMGAVTYCFYVWHEPIILSLRKLFSPNLRLVDSIVIFPIGFISTIIVSIIFYVFIEKYYDRMKR